MGRIFLQSELDSLLFSLQSEVDSLLASQCVFAKIILGFRLYHQRTPINCLFASVLEIWPLEGQYVPRKKDIYASFGHCDLTITKMPHKSHLVFMISLAALIYQQKRSFFLDIIYT